MSLIKMLYYFTIIFGYVPVAVYLAKAKRFPRYIHIFAAFLILSAVTDVIGMIFLRLSIYTYLLFNIYDVLQFLLLSWFYYEIIFKKNGGLRRGTKYIFIPLCLVYLISLLLLSLNVQSPFSTHQFFVWTIGAIIFITYGCLYLIHLFLAVARRNNLQINILVWINSGVLYYFGIMILLLLTREYHRQEWTREKWEFLWSFNNLSNIIKNSLITFGLAFYAENLEV